ncbi:hypothetical protein ACWGDE_04655 [Streptomyces sp. NPDC054956]
MDDLPGLNRNSSEVERGEAPEVVTLGKTLTQLFNSLGVTQKVYGVRVSLDNTTVCRYLGGTRVPPKFFIEQLIREVESDKGVPLQESAKETVHQQYLAALKVTGKNGEYELAVMRDELELAKREVARARRSVESLHLLLDSKEEEAQGLKVDLQRMELDWSRERSSTAGLQRAYEDSAGQAESLMGQIRELKAQLEDAETRREEAEGRSASLREEVLRLEELLSEHAVAPAVERAPFEELKAKFSAEPKGSALALARQLSDAAWSRPVDEVIEMYAWLVSTRSVEEAARFSGDVARLRDLGESIDFFAAVCSKAPGAVLDRLMEGVGARIEGANVSYVCGRLKDVQAGRRRPVVAADELMSAFGNPRLNLRIPGMEYFALLAAIRPEDRYSPPTYTAMRLVTFRSRTDLGGIVPILLGVSALGWEELCITALAYLGAKSYGGLLADLDRLPPGQAKELLELSASFRHDPIDFRGRTVVSVAALFADALHADHTSPWLGRYLQILESAGGLDLLAHAESAEVRKRAAAP